jgi:RNA polymerase sigma-70 factor (ECF subfamily)
VINRQEGQATAAGELAELTATMARADAFRRLSEQHLGAAYRLARAILYEPAEAEDAVQDAFVRAWRNWAALRDPNRFEPWFDRILVNSCRNRLRSQARARVTDISGELDLAEPGDQYAAARDREQLSLALSQLDGDHRVVVALRFFADLTIDEIAVRMNLRPGTVKSRLHHAMQRLRAALVEPSARGTLR